MIEIPDFKEIRAKAIAEAVAKFLIEDVFKDEKNTAKVEIEGVKVRIIFAPGEWLYIYCEELNPYFYSKYPLKTYFSNEGTVDKKEFIKILKKAI